MTAVTNQKRTCDTGLVRPYRPCPADFRERFLEMGQSKEIEDHYRTNWRVIRRWINQCGGDELRLERSKITGVPTKNRRSSARRYVMGQTLGGTK